jgi:uncharacterized membrane protein YgaE (UPF0421/DUF939 family)
MMELLLAIHKEMKADREKWKADMEEILSKMEERMTATQAKTDGKLKELTETIEKKNTDGAKSRNDAVRRGASRSP